MIIVEKEMKTFLRIMKGISLNYVAFINLSLSINYLLWKVMSSIKKKRDVKLNNFHLLMNHRKTKVSSLIYSEGLMLIRKRNLSYNRNTNSLYWTNTFNLPTMTQSTCTESKMKHLLHNLKQISPLIDTLNDEP
jgi:hypothetical protein